jgi:hypothetical protein
MSALSEGGKGFRAGAICPIVGIETTLKMINASSIVISDKCKILSGG